MGLRAPGCRWARGRSAGCGGGPDAMTVHGGVLRLSTPGNGAIVDLTEGPRSIVRRSELSDCVAVGFAVGAPVAVTTMEHEPGGIADVQALLDRLVPAA